jgi:membrane protease YdiL (CAAX protease family)
MHSRRRLSLGFLAVALYLSCGFILRLIVGGVDYDDLADSNHSILLGILLPAGVGSLVLIAFVKRLGWGRQVFAEAPVRPTSWWAIPGLLVLCIAILLATTEWAQWQATTLALLLPATLLVGFGEELMVRGLLLVSLRGSLSERWVWFLTSLTFGLIHGVNILVGQAVGKTLVQIPIAFFLGTALYATRRVTGLLAVGMLIHGLYDFSVFTSRGPNHSPLGQVAQAGKGLAGLCILGGIAVSLRLIKELTRGAPETAPIAGTPLPAAH